MAFEIADILNSSGLVVALVALVISVYNWQIASHAARNDVVAQVRDWGNDVIDVLSDADAMCALDPRKLPEAECSLRKSALMSRTSSLIDRGRLFFPNTYRNRHGGHKPPAFRGFRPAILDLLALSYELTNTIDSVNGRENDRRGHAFIHLRKVFVSAIQDATIFSAPSTVRKYEIHMTRILIDPMPDEILLLANAQDKGFQLTFDKDSLFDTKRHNIKHE